MKTGIRERIALRKKRKRFKKCADSIHNLHIENVVDAEEVERISRRTLIKFFGKGIDSL